MTEFVLKNKYFEFDSSVFQQILGTTIGSKFMDCLVLVPLYR